MDIWAGAGGGVRDTISGWRSLAWKNVFRQRGLRGHVNMGGALGDNAEEENLAWNKIRCWKVKRLVGGVGVRGMGSSNA